MRLVLAMVLAALVGFPFSASAQAGEEGATPEPNLQEPAPVSEPTLEEPVPPSQPAPDEPALELKLDDAGVGVVPAPPRTSEGYTLEEMERRVKRAKIGLGVSGGLYAIGLGLVVGAIVYDDRNPTPEGEISFGGGGAALGVTGSMLMLGGMIGMIVSGVRLARNKRDRDWLRRANYRRPPPRPMGPGTVATRVLRGGYRLDEPRIPLEC